MLSRSNARVRESFMKEIRSRLRKAIRSEPFVLHVCSRCGFPDVLRVFYEDREVVRWCPRCRMASGHAAIEVLPHSRVPLWIAYLEGHEIALSAAFVWHTCKSGDVGCLHGESVHGEHMIQPDRT